MYMFIQSQFSANLETNTFGVFKLSSFNGSGSLAYSYQGSSSIVPWLVLACLLDEFEGFMQEYAWLHMFLLCCLIPALKHKN